jgi:hypothetical protein
MLQPWLLALASRLKKLAAVECSEKCLLYFGRYYSLEPIPSGRAVEDLALRPLTCWDYGLESRRRPGCLSLVSVVRCKVEISATG